MLHKASVAITVRRHKMMSIVWSTGIPYLGKDILPGPSCSLIGRHQGFSMWELDDSA